MKTFTLNFINTTISFGLPHDRMYDIDELGTTELKSNWWPMLSAAEENPDKI